MKKRTHRCTAKSSRTGKPCQRAPINGGTVCATHGGRAPQVKRKADERIREYVRQMVDPDRVLQEAARLAMSDIRELYDDNGNLLPIKKLSGHIAAAVKSSENIRGNRNPADGQWDPVVKLTLHGKEKSLEMLAKHLNLLDERIHHDGKLVVSWED